MIPTSIDGTDITGATIDGTDVQEITVDGQTVFTAEKLPVAYSNLVAWYPFDSSFYGGSDADDVTALFNPGQSGDSTAYDGTVNGATYQSSGGVTDINAGQNSGAFDFDTNDSIELNNATAFAASEFTISMWLKSTDTQNWGIFDFINGSSNNRVFVQLNGNATGTEVGQMRFFTQNSNDLGSVSLTNNPNLTDGVYHHIACVRDFNEPNNGRIHIDGGVKEALDIGNSGIIGTNLVNEDVGIGGNVRFGSGNIELEDVRLYNTALTQSEINDIYQNTES